MATGVKIRSKCEWYEFGRRYSKLFLNLENQYTFLNQVQPFLCSVK